MLERNQPFYKVRLAKHRSLFAIPVPELAKAMNIAPGRAVQVCKAAYWLSKCTSRILQSSLRLLNKPWIRTAGHRAMRRRFRARGPVSGKLTTREIICSHVDDFLIVGDQSCSIWNQALTSFYNRFRWSPWEHSAFTFTHCGIVIKETCDGGKILDHSKYCETVTQIPVQKDRSDKSPATDEEISQLRALLGAVQFQWRSYNSGPQHSVTVGHATFSGDKSLGANPSGSQQQVSQRSTWPTPFVYSHRLSSMSAGRMLQ